MIDWSAVEMDYIEGVTRNGEIVWLTLAEVAERNEINATWLRERASAGKWRLRRAEYQRHLAAERHNLRALELARIGADLDVSAARAARTGMALVSRRLSELGEMHVERQRAHQRGARNGALPPAPSSEEVGVLARAAVSWYDLGNRALGDIGNQMIDVPTSEEDDDEIEASRDERTQRIMAVLVAARALPAELEGVIETNGHDVVRGAFGNGQGHPGEGADSEDDEVYPPDDR